MILKANCKINLGLDILRRRADGFHDLETVMFPVAGLYDEVEVVRTAAPGAEFRAEGLAVDCAPGENICLKAFRLMQRHYGVDGVAIRLGKRVPFGAGLGGGSSDGTAVLLAVNELFALGLSEAELIARAAELGSDTAFFVRNTPQLCKGRGEVMEPFALNLKGMTLVIVKPGEGVSTREAYAGVRPRIPEVPLAERLGRPVAEWQGLVTNDFEEHIFAAHPAIRAAKERLLAEGAVYASMSGSGSAVSDCSRGMKKAKGCAAFRLSYSVCKPLRRGFRRRFPAVLPEANPWAAAPFRFCPLRFCPLQPRQFRTPSVTVLSTSVPSASHPASYVSVRFAPLVEGVGDAVGNVLQGACFRRFRLFGAGGSICSPPRASWRCARYGVRLRTRRRNRRRAS